MKINFMLPSIVKTPSGGIKVIYNYANELSILGHNIVIISPKREGNKLFDFIKSLIKKIRDFYDKVENTSYYSVLNNVKYLEIPTPNKKYIPNADIIIATGWQTADWINQLPRSKGTKFYFIQGKETWLGGHNKVMNTWRMPLKKIVISNWLKEAVMKIDDNVLGPVSNTIDNNEFFITKEIKKRPNQITMLYHRASVKRGKDGIKVFKEIRKKNKNIKFLIFTARKPLLKIPKWITIEIRPTINKLREIYNSTSIFIHTSSSEGWGLSPAESMMCGCAVVATSNLGIKEYIKHRQTGLLSPIGDISSLIHNVQYLIDNNEIRIALAEKGNKQIKLFSLENNTKKLEKIIINNS